jgi:hypothetical protein
MLRNMILELRNDDVVCYAVNTATGSEYLLDLDRRTLTRTMASVQPLLDFIDVGFSRLRRDGETLPVSFLERLKVGYSASFFLLIRAVTVPSSRS